jgi:hypothetical protein
MLKGWRDAAKAGVPFEVSVKSHKDARSLEANRFYWSRLNEIAQKAEPRFSAEAWHEYLKRKFIGCLDLPSGQVIGMSTTKLNSTEFALYTTQVEAFAVMELGVIFTEDAA